jgi:hypothetical protein
VPRSSGCDGHDPVAPAAPAGDLAPHSRHGGGAAGGGAKQHHARCATSRPASLDWTIGTGRGSPAPSAQPQRQLGLADSQAAAAAAAEASSAALHSCLYTPEALSRRGTRRSRRTTTSIACESASLAAAPCPGPEPGTQQQDHHQHHDHHQGHAAALLPAAQQHLQAGRPAEAKEALQRYLALQLDLGHHVAGPGATAQALGMLGDALLQLGHPAAAAVELYTSAAALLAQLCGEDAGGSGEQVRLLRQKMSRAAGGSPAAAAAGAAAGGPAPLPVCEAAGGSMAAAGGRQRAASSAGSARAAPQEPHAGRGAGCSRADAPHAGRQPGAAAARGAPPAPPRAWRWRPGSPIQRVTCQGERASPQQPLPGGAGGGVAGALWRLGAQLLRRAAPGAAASAAAAPLASQGRQAAEGGAGAATPAAPVAGSASFGTACSSSQAPDLGASAAGDSQACSTPSAARHGCSCSAAEGPAGGALAAVQQAAAQQQAASPAGSWRSSSAAGLDPPHPKPRWWPGCRSSSRGRGPAPAPAAPGAAAAPACAHPAAALPDAAQVHKVALWLGSCDDRDAWQQHLQRLALQEAQGQGTPGWCTPATASTALSRSSSAAWSGTLLPPR